MVPYLISTLPSFPETKFPHKTYIRPRLVKDCFSFFCSYLIFLIKIKALYSIIKENVTTTNWQNIGKVYLQATALGICFSMYIKKLLLFLE